MTTKTNRPIEYVEGQTEIWCLLCPFGEFPGVISMPDGSRRDVLQICDNKAFTQVMANFKPEILVDFEHRSEMPQLDSDTAASGWVQELRIGPEGLECRNKLTDLGADDLRNRRRRFLSPVWPLGEDMRPITLKSVALTNTPNIHGQPVLNKDPAHRSPNTDHRSLATPLTSAAVAGNKTERRVRMDPEAYNKLAAKLGLKEGHTPADFESAITGVLNKAAQVDSLSARVADLEKKAQDTALGNEADACISANKGRIADEVAFRKAYVANKDSTLAVLAATQVPAATVANKNEAHKPAIATGVVENKLTAFRAMKPGKERDTFLAANKQEIVALENEERKGK